MRILPIAVVLSLVSGSVAGAAFQAATVERAPIPATVCGSAVAAQLRTTLYFGTTRPTGAVSELEWQMFLRDEVTKRFPDGLTVWDAQGQWKVAKGTIVQERTKVLLLVHPDTTRARGDVQDVIETYRKMFEQESVLWETASVCISS